MRKLNQLIKTIKKKQLNFKKQKFQKTKLALNKIQSTTKKYKNWFFCTISFLRLGVPEIKKVEKTGNSLRDNENHDKGTYYSHGISCQCKLENAVQFREFFCHNRMDI